MFVLSRLLVATAVALLLSTAARADIERISIAERTDGRGFVVRLHANAAVPAFRVEQRSATTVDLILQNTQAVPSLRQDDARGVVQSYTLRRDGTRLVLSVHLRQTMTVQAYPDGTTNDVLLALSYPEGQPRPVAQGPTQPDAESRAHWRLDCIVIDAGHGGRDPGALGHGAREKDITLAVARRLGQYVQSELGMQVVYTRSDDRFIELHDRGRIANQSCGKLFVSIHVNAAGSARASGTEVYFLGMHRSESAREVMERENSVIRLESDPNLYGDFGSEALILQELATSAYMRESQELASLVNDQFTNRVQRPSRGVKQAGFIVLWRASMPAILVELGFISNPEEARFLSSERGQDLLASGLFRAIKSYKERYERGLMARGE